MYRSNKRQRIEKFPKGVSIKTSLRSVQEAGFVLCKIETKTATSPRARSRSVLQAKLLALGIKALSKNADVYVLIADVPKGERNLNPTKNQYSINFTSFGLSSCSKTFCIAKKWWDIRPLNSYGTSNHILNHCSSHFKGLYDTKEILLLVMKMADNHLRNFYCHHMLQHGGDNFPYFDYDIKNKTSEIIKADANVKKSRAASKLTEIDLETKKRRNACNKDLPYMIVHEVRF